MLHINIVLLSHHHGRRLHSALVTAIIVCCCLFTFSFYCCCLQCLALFQNQLNLKAICFLPPSSVSPPCHIRIALKSWKLPRCDTTRLVRFQSAASFLSSSVQLNSVALLPLSLSLMLVSGNARRRAGVFGCQPLACIACSQFCHLRAFSLSKATLQLHYTLSVVVRCRKNSLVIRLLHVGSCCHLWHLNVHQKAIAFRAFLLYSYFNSSTAFSSSSYLNYNCTLYIA